ncbi:hypothetical protein ACR77J_12055 [Tissierella praeacuta]|uniref:hypothetical protein n=1 Tax=Tissierella praeacuta TaxID=43131 RepID=UPI003DA66E8C
MFKKYKQLIIGFLLGALLFSIVPVSATIQEYLLQKSSAKLIVNGKEFSNKDLPVLNHKGYNYIPAATFREVCNTIGVSFEWVGGKNEIQIDTNKKPIVETIEKPVGERKVNNVTEKIEKDGYSLLVVDGVEYIGLREIIDHHSGYGFIYNEDSKKVDFIYNSSRFGSPKLDEVLLKDIPYDIFTGTTYTKYNFFKETLFPLINVER